MSEATVIKIEEKNIPKIISERLQKLKTDFKDEIPEEIVHSYSNFPKNIKARKGGWFGPVVAYLNLGLDQGEITDPKIAEEISDFTKYCVSGDFHTNERTSEADIRRANRMIDLYLSHCKTKPANTIKTREL